MSKKSPTSPTERNPKPEYLIAKGNLLRGPLVRSHSILIDGAFKIVVFVSLPGRMIQFDSYCFRLVETTKYCNVEYIICGACRISFHQRYDLWIASDYPKRSMGLVYLPTLWLILMVNAGRYTIHGSYGYVLGFISSLVIFPSRQDLFRKHFSAANLRLQGGPLPVISRVVIPFMGVTTPVTHL